MKRIQNLRDLRSEVLELLERTPHPTLLLDISKRLRIKADSLEYEQLRTSLEKLCDEGKVERHSRRRYSLVRLNKKSAPAVTAATAGSAGLIGVLMLYHESATVKMNDKDFPIIHIRREHLNTALDGDVVLVQPHAMRRGKRLFGEVLEILERSPHAIAGKIQYDGSFYFLVPDDSKYYVDFLINKKNLKGAKPGQKVLGAFLRWEQANASPEATIEEVIGTSGQVAVEFTAIYKEFRLPAAFPAEVEEEASKYEQPVESTQAAHVGSRDSSSHVGSRDSSSHVGSRVPRDDDSSRVSLVDELIVTIDPVDARDFDDALSLRKLPNGNVELGVHIADVSHYVREGTALDKEALKRGNSTYLVDGVVPMLPEHLSNNICSLVPNQVRYAYSVFMEFSSRGGRKSYRIAETAIKSKRRYSYEEVQQIIDTGVGDNHELILELHKLARALHAERMRHGGISFETQEVKFILDENKMPVSAVVKSATMATGLVEECMLAANRTVAEHVESLKKQWSTKEAPPLVYRIHDNPDESKLTDALNVIRAIGISVPSGKLNPAQINNILKQAENMTQKPMVHQLLLRSMAKAVYAEHNVGHYGLGFHAYAHFTSPIRRYPDLYVHRVLKEYARTKPDERRWRALLSAAGDISDHSSQTERASVDAERASSKLAQVMLAREHIGEDYEATVTGVTSFGVFLMLDTLMCEGLLHIRDLDDDYYDFDEKTYRLVGKRRKRTIQFGSRFKVRIVKADVGRRMIDLRIAISE